MGATLANGGKAPGTKNQVIAPHHNRKLLSVMLTCGMYNYAGEWFYEVGLPAKSGVSGGILSVVPGKMGIASYSPLIDSKGSSQKAVISNQLLSERLGLHMFTHNEMLMP